MNYYFRVYNASGLVTCKRGPFASLNAARNYARELLREREYRGHQAEVFFQRKPHDVSMGVFYSTQEAV